MLSLSLCFSVSPNLNKTWYTQTDSWKTESVLGLDTQQIEGQVKLATVNEENYLSKEGNILVWKVNLTQDHSEATEANCLVKLSVKYLIIWSNEPWQLRLQIWLQYPIFLQFNFLSVAWETLPSCDRLQNIQIKSCFPWVYLPWCKAQEEDLSFLAVYAPRGFRGLGWRAYSMC